MPVTVSNVITIDHPPRELLSWCTKNMRLRNPEYDKKANWTLFDLQDKLMQSGWMVPAYTMPKNIEDMVVMRIVVRQGMSRDMADMLIADITDAVAELEKLQFPTPSRLAARRSCRCVSANMTVRRCRAYRSRT